MTDPANVNALKSAVALLHKALAEHGKATPPEVSDAARALLQAASTITATSAPSPADKREYPVNPHGPAVRAALAQYRRPNRYGWQWNKVLDFIADHMPTTPDNIAHVLQQAADRALLSHIPYLGASVFANLQAIYEFSGEYDNNNASPAPVKFAKFMREYRME